jgi:hypothetical protein
MKASTVHVTNLTPPGSANPTLRVPPADVRAQPADRGVPTGVPVRERGADAVLAAGRGLRRARFGRLPPAPPRHGALRRLLGERRCDRQRGVTSAAESDAHHAADQLPDARVVGLLLGGEPARRAGALHGGWIYKLNPADP